MKTKSRFSVLVFMVHLTVAGICFASKDSATIVPSQRQLGYQMNQLGAFIHFGLATFSGGDYFIAPDPNIFNPTSLDAEQWVLTAKSFGAKHVMFAAKHHSGFCLWPTETTDYSVKSSPWKNGNGDVVREVADACRKHGLELGLYCSPADIYYGCYEFQGRIMGDPEEYLIYFMRQIHELMTNYGPVTAVWLDGWGDPFYWWHLNPKTGEPLGDSLGNAIASLIRCLQPNANIFFGSQPDVRFAGSEEGRSPYPLWNTIRQAEEPIWINPNCPDGWFIPEVTMPTRIIVTQSSTTIFDKNMAGWFWVPNSDENLATIDRLMRAYYESIGYGANMLLNLTPDITGKVPEAEIKLVKEFGAEVRRRFSQPIARTDSSKGWGDKNTLELNLGKTWKIDHVTLEEDIAKGQNIKAYAIDARVNGTWKAVIPEGLSIGRKRINRFRPVVADKIRLRLSATVGDTHILEMAAYGVSE